MLWYLSKNVKNWNFLCASLCPYLSKSSNNSWKYRPWYSSNSFIWRLKGRISFSCSRSDWKTERVIKNIKSSSPRESALNRCDRIRISHKILVRSSKQLKHSSIATTALEKEKPNQQSARLSPNVKDKDDRTRKKINFVGIKETWWRDSWNTRIKCWRWNT